ncbi:MAG TPA: MarR family transcriptional regulator [Pseudolysinimonas sp.]|jgi:DNA-binding MarR family transcriptional regulator
MAITEIERGAHLIGDYLEPVIAQLGVTQAEAHVLSQLDRSGSTAIGTLHHEFGRKRSTLTNVIDRLEQRGCVRRELNLADRRSFILHLTPEGQQAASVVTAALDRLEHDLAARASADDLAAIDRVIDALAHAVRVTGAEAR